MPTNPRCLIDRVLCTGAAIVLVSAACRTSTNAPPTGPSAATSTGTGTSPTPSALPTSCEALRDEYMQLVVRTPCTSAADCKDERAPDPQCFTGTHRVNLDSVEGKRTEELLHAFTAHDCPVAPCDPPTIQRTTRCMNGLCTTEPG